ncbi:MAG: hypothetical protein L3K15_02860 [Thermoplasmata archaeon]|nr:hypothetical protein [Thermoplasmata archaeon]
MSGRIPAPPRDPSEPPYRPPVLRRIVVGSMILVGLIFVFVVLPTIALRSLSAYGVTSGVPLPAITAGGFVLAGLSAIRYVVKPTRAYGPVGVVRALAAVGYLFLFAPFGTVSATLMGAQITVTYGDLLLVALAIPLLSLAASALTTAEDLRHPYERLRYDFPPPGAGWR